MLTHMLTQPRPRLAVLLFVASVLWVSVTPTAAQTGNDAASSARTPYVGIASWYGEQHQGRIMANGQRFDLHKLTAASWYFPLGTKLHVVNLQNGKAELVTVTDRGPNLRLNRIIDLSEAAAAALGYLHQGLTPVFVFPVVVVAPEEARITASLKEPRSIDAPQQSGFHLVALANSTNARKSLELQ